MRRLAGLGAFLVVAAMTIPVTAGAEVSGDKAVLQQLRQLSGRYHSPARAEADGFLEEEVCVAAPGLGGMGYHFVNPGRFDGTFEADKPEIMLYGSKPDGGMRLLGVEYAVVDADQNTATDGDRPWLGDHPFDGPMEGHFPGMPVHYDLHVWTWQDNPAGPFAIWNPSVTCP